MSDVISLLVPTRGRPNNMRRFSESVHATSHGPVEIVWRIDNDDIEAIHAALDLCCTDQVSSSFVIAPRRIPTVAWNEAWTVADGDIFGLMGDDIVMQTPGWDDLVRAEFEKVPDRILLVYGRDGFRDHIHASHPFLHRRWADTLGYATPTYFSQDMNDVWLNGIADRIGRRVFVPELVTQHLHPDDPSLGVEVDQTYLENRERRDRDRTHELYDELAPLRDRDVEKLLAAVAA